MFRLTRRRALALIDLQAWDRAPGCEWGTALLPCLEPETLAAQSDDRSPVRSARHVDAVATRLPLNLCPSASRGNEPRIVRDGAGDPVLVDGNRVRLARAHYAASHDQEFCWGKCGADTAATIFTGIDTALSATCNLKDETRLEAIANMIAAGMKQHELSPREPGRLLDTVEVA